LYDPTANPVPAQSGSGSSRFAYLVSRLRNRQITMEEATELFALQQTMISQASAMNRTPPPEPPEATESPPPPPPTEAVVGAFSDENVALGLLAMGAGAGLLAAVLKRAQEGPKPSP
jgi:hypothetical protein